MSDASGEPKGWVKVYRRAQRSPELAEADALGFWVWLLTEAAHRPTRVYVGSRRVRVDLGVGQLVMAASAPPLGLTEKRVRTLLQRFTSADMVTVKTGRTTGRIITIEMWQQYQSLDSHGADEGRTTGRTKGGRRADEGRTHRIQEPKNIDNVPSERADEPPGANPAADLWREGVAVLVEAGSLEASARRLLGRIKRDHGAEALLGAIDAARREAPPDPAAFLVAAAKARAASGQPGRGPPVVVDWQAEMAARLARRFGRDGPEGDGRGGGDGPDGGDAAVERLAR